MNPPLDVLQVGDDCKRHDHQQRPRTPFPQMDDGPRAHLVRVFPDAEEGADVLGQPDEKADQDEGQDYAGTNSLLDVLQVG
jgi:hypothetical protein